MPIETEIKFRVDDLAGLARRLEAAGFRLQTPRAFESNVLYDTPDRQMRARTEILRIRGYAGRTTVTHKRLPDVGPGEDTHKHRIETETEVADGAALEQIFLSLGLVAAFRYEKWRAEWTDGEGHCVVDETPIGNYAELEGSAEWIDRAAARLGVAPAQYTTLSYGRLFDLWRAERRSEAQDMTFAAGFPPFPQKNNRRSFDSPFPSQSSGSGSAQDDRAREIFEAASPASGNAPTQGN